MDKLVVEATEVASPVRWSDDVRELAYQHWAFTSGRNAEKVARALAEIGHPVTSRSIRTWADDGGWALRAHEDLGRIAPDIRQQTIAELIYGGLEAARGLRSVVVGDLPSDVLAQVDTLLGNEELDAGERDKRLSDLYNRAERLLKTRTTAYVAMLDRAGFSPVGSNAPELPRVSVAEQAKAYRDMTPSERVEEQRRQLDAQRLPAKTARRKR